MLKKEEYIKIKKYLDNKQYNELEEYIYYLNNQRLIKIDNNTFIDKDKNEDYIKNARKALLDYFQKYSLQSYISYIDDDKLLITNLASIYIFNNDEILSRYRKNKLINGGYNQKKEIIDRTRYFLEETEKLESSNEIIITNKIEKYPHRTYEYYAIEDLDTHYIEYFHYGHFQNLIDFSDGKVKIKMYPSKRLCIIESEKGKGLICPIKKTNHYD